MFPFWEVAIAPVFDAVRPKRVLEVGALRGENTVLMMQKLGPGVELHVVDPVPSFDPAEHEKAFPGRYIFHRDLSVNALPHIEPVDVALLDGDHNWYTVHQELTILAEVARAGGAPLPVMLMHDVCWPYGRRDLYYDPTNIPAEHRQPFARKGINLGQKKLSPTGGLNAELPNAIEEGGPRNGVMTGLDDFVAEYDKPLRVLVLPVYFGLALVAEEERLAKEPELAAVFDRLESAEGRFELMEMTEGTRLREAVFYHYSSSLMRQRNERVANRYLDTVKGALVNQFDIENELRLDLVVQCLEEETTPALEQIRDPGSIRAARRDEALAARQVGRRSDAPTPDEPVPYFPFTLVGRDALDHVHRTLDKVRSEGVEGDLVHTGVGRGGVGIFLRAYLDAHEDTGRRVWLFDRFHAADHAHHPRLKEPLWSGGGRGFPGLGADLHQVREAFARFDVFDDQTTFVQGDIDQTVPKSEVGDIALLHIGADQDVDAEAALELLYDRVAVGGHVIVDGIRSGSTSDQVEEFRRAHGITATLEHVGWNTVAWVKQDEAPPAPLPSPQERVRALLSKAKRSVVGAGAPRVSPAPKGSPELSVVVVFYNMKREAERTLHSLTRGYQQGIDDLPYEVVVVENGSKPNQTLGADYVRGFGPEFRYVDMAGEAKPSPVFALNKGIEVSRGRYVALMIDGAHMLTPGVLRHGIDGMRLHEPAVVLTQQWYLGPGQQGDAMIDGYDQKAEDELLERIAWPEDGYRLFDVSHFIGGRDWFDGQWESNCLFVPRSHLGQVGAFDESFVTAGGGFANLELFERLAASPDVTMATILGEGSFHQVHGGTTTNLTDVAERSRRVATYGDEYAELRGKMHRAPAKRMHYVGAMTPNAVRTRPRRMTSAELFQAPVTKGPDARPSKPEPIPDELREHYVQSFWRSLAWREGTWMGQRIYKSPTDLFAYQEILAEVRPDWVIETRTVSGARAHFFADMCELLGHGQVLTIDHKVEGERRAHPRITYLDAEYTWGEETKQMVADIVGPEPKALVVLGSAGGKERMVYEFETFMDFVPVGSYVIIEETILNGHPVYPGRGPGPYEAAGLIQFHHPEFVADPERERYGLSFNAGGFLRRERPSPTPADD